MSNNIISDLNDVNLPYKEAYALALLPKRLTWSQLRACAVDEDNTYLILDTVYKLQKDIESTAF